MVAGAAVTTGPTSETAGSSLIVWVTGSTWMFLGFLIQAMEAVSFLTVIWRLDGLRLVWAPDQASLTGCLLAAAG